MTTTQRRSVFWPRQTWQPYKWWLAGGVPETSAIGVWQAIKWPSLDDSYVNLANPGTNDLVPVVAPTWTYADGWTFNGSTTYCRSGLWSAGNMSWIVRATLTSSTNKMPFGAGNTSNNNIGVMPNWSSGGVVYYNGGLLIKTPGLTSGNHVLAAAGTAAIRDGVQESGSIDSTFSGVSVEIFVGADNANGSVNLPCDFVVQALALYAGVLTVAQMQAITTAMQAL